MTAAVSSGVDGPPPSGAWTTGSARSAGDSTRRRYRCGGSASELGERRAPGLERRPGRRHLVAGVEVHADVAGRPLGEALGEALGSRRARAGLALVATPAGRDAGVQARGEVGRDEGEVHDVAELVQDQAVDATLTEGARHRAEVQPDVVAVGPRRRRAQRAALRGADGDGDEAVDDPDEPPRLGARAGDRV